MKVSKKSRRNIGCAYLAFCFALIILQVVFLTLKCTGAIEWSWWAVCIPALLVFVLPVAVLIVVILALIPKAMWKSWKTAKRVDAEAELYGMKRQPGESTSDLKKRIVRRNMISGNYSRKDIKDMILDKYPAVGSCMVASDPRDMTITLILRRAYATEPGAGFTDDQLCEIASFAAEYIPVNYTITARNA